MNNRSVNGAGPPGDYDDLGLFGIGSDDSYYGSYDVDELGDCPGCGGQLAGYFGDYPDQELIGHYCPHCEAQGTEAGLTDTMGYFGQDEADYDAYATEDELGIYDHDPDAGYGYYGPYRDQDLGGFGDMDGYVSEERPSFNPRGSFGDQLAGYESEKSVNPMCDLRSTVPTTPPPRVPSFFKPHF